MEQSRNGFSMLSSASDHEIQNIWCINIVMFNQRCINVDVANAWIANTQLIEEEKKLLMGMIALHMCI